MDFDVRPVVDAVLELQLRQTQLPADSLGADIAVERRRRRGGRLRVTGVAGETADRRPRGLRRHAVLGVPGDRGHVVRGREFFRQKDRSVVDRDRGPHAVHVLDRSDVDLHRKLQQQPPVAGPGTGVFLGREPDGRIGRIVLRQGVRYDRHVFVGLPAPVQCQLEIRPSDV